MPTKASRRVPLPAGLVPLLTQAELETFYRVSDWTVLKWIKRGMPVEPMKSATGEKQERRFDLEQVKAWHAENVLAVSA